MVRGKGLAQITPAQWLGADLLHPSVVAQRNQLELLLLQRGFHDLDGGLAEAQTSGARCVREVRCSGGPVVQCVGERV